MIKSVKIFITFFEILIAIGKMEEIQKPKLCNLEDSILFFIYKLTNNLIELKL